MTLIEVDEGTETVLMHRFQYFDLLYGEERVKKHWFPVQAYRRTIHREGIWSEDRLTILRVALQRWPVESYCNDKELRQSPPGRN